jgi:hypothetical protein
VHTVCIARAARIAHSAHVACNARVVRAVRVVRAMRVACAAHGQQLLGGQGESGWCANNMATARARCGHGAGAAVPASPSVTNGCCGVHCSRFLLCRKAMVVKFNASVGGVWCVMGSSNQTSELQSHFSGGWGDLAGNDLGTGSGWKHSRQNRTPLCSDETRSPNSIAHIDTPLAARFHLFFALSLDGFPIARQDSELHTLS